MNQIKSKLGQMMRLNVSWNICFSLEWNCYFERHGPGSFLWDFKDQHWALHFGLLHCWCILFCKESEAFKNTKLTRTSNQCSHLDKWNHILFHHDIHNCQYSHHPNCASDTSSIFLRFWSWIAANGKWLHEVIEKL